MRPRVRPVNDNAVVVERVRLRVLAVDDNAMVADEVAAMLSAEGLEVVGPATTPEDALDFALRAALDAAVLDVRLRDDTVFPVAKVLQVRRVPFRVPDRRLVRRASGRVRDRPIAGQAFSPAGPAARRVAPPGRPSGVSPDGEGSDRRPDADDAGPLGVERVVGGLGQVRGDVGLEGGLVLERDVEVVRVEEVVPVVPAVP